MKTSSISSNFSVKPVASESQNQEKYHSRTHESRAYKTSDGSQSSLKISSSRSKTWTSHRHVSTIKMKKNINISTKTKGLWDVNITLQFYIRGVSRDHIATLDATILSLLDKGGSKNSLMAQWNMLLKACNGCSEAPQIRDIIHLLEQARSAYDSFVLEERDPKKTSLQ